jgi:hypothetical protein
MGPDKRTLIVASSLAAIPLATVLVAATIYRRRPKSLQKSTFLGQDTRSKTSVITATATRKQQQREKSQAQLHSPRHGSEAGATTTTTTTAAISTNTVVADKDITPPEVAPSPMVGSITSDSQTIVPSSQTPKEEDIISVSDEARKAGESLKELIATAIKEAKDSAKGTGKRLKEQTINIAATADSKNIQSLGDNINFLVGLFEETMTEIRKERYNEQIKLLDSYKDLLHSHIKVVDARRRMASKLKPGA